MLALIGFALMIVLMFVLIKEKMAPPLAFILLPIIAAVLAGFGVADISEFIKTGMKTMMNTAILFIFSISYFTLMSDAGLFDPIIIGVVEPFGVTPETVAAAFLLTATLGTPVSPSVAAVYVGLGLADVSIGEHIKYSLRLVWPASIAVLVMATVIGVIKF